MLIDPTSFPRLFGKFWLQLQKTVGMVLDKILVKQSSSPLLRIWARKLKNRGHNNINNFTLTVRKRIKFDDHFEGSPMIDEDIVSSAAQRQHFPICEFNYSTLISTITLITKGCEIQAQKICSMITIDGESTNLLLQSKSKEKTAATQLILAFPKWKNRKKIQMILRKKYPRKFLKRNLFSNTTDGKQQRRKRASNRATRTKRWSGCGRLIS